MAERPGRRGGAGWAPGQRPLAELRRRGLPGAPLVVSLSLPPAVLPLHWPEGWRQKLTGYCRNGVPPGVLPTAAPGLWSAWGGRLWEGSPAAGWPAASLPPSRGAGVQGGEQGDVRPWPGMRPRFCQFEQATV